MKKFFGDLLFEDYQDLQSWVVPKSSSLPSEGNIIEKTKKVVVDEKQQIISCLGENHHLRFFNKKTIKVCFLLDQFYRLGEVKKGNDLDEIEAEQLNLVFAKKTQSLFSKMIKAMQLSLSEIFITTVNIDEKEKNPFLEKEIILMKPSLIISLGAKATEFILKEPQRLAEVHGEFFPVKFGEREIQVMPLFHPELLLINTNMKKVAWYDMQKAMQYFL